MSLHPFVVYNVESADGSVKHSSILYDDRLQPGVTPTPAELREMLLTSASYAGMEFEWPEHGHDDGKQLTLSIFGPFFPGSAADKITTAEYHALDEDDLP